MVAQKPPKLLGVGSNPTGTAIDSKLNWLSNLNWYDVRMKTCNTCHISKPETEFAIKRTKKNWSKQYNSICKICHNNKAREKYKTSPSEFRQKIYTQVKTNRNKYRTQMLEFLQTQQCADCWISDARVLEFDHLSNKKFNIGNKVPSTPLHTLMNEIQKCEIVCCNCHRIRTLNRCNSYKTKSTQ